MSETLTIQFRGDSFEFNKYHFLSKFYILCFKIYIITILNKIILSSQRGKLMQLSALDSFKYERYQIINCLLFFLINHHRS